MTVQLSPEQATLDGAKSALNAEDHELDADFGLVPVDPEHDLYAVMVDPRVAERVQGAPGVEGPFSNPKIETQGPPEE